MCEDGRGLGIFVAGSVMHPLMEEHLEEIRALCREFGVSRLELFGSAAKTRVVVYDAPNVTKDNGEAAHVAFALLSHEPGDNARFATWRQRMMDARANRRYALRLI